jgi:hypothetical protein
MTAQIQAPRQRAQFEVRTRYPQAHGEQQIAFRGEAEVMFGVVEGRFIEVPLPERVIHLVDVRRPLSEE